MEDFALLLPEGLIVGGVLLLLLYSLFGTSKALLMRMMGGVLLAVLMLLFAEVGQQTTGVFVQISPFITSLKCLLVFMAGAHLVMADPYMNRSGIGKDEYFHLILFVLLGLMVMLSASDFLMLFVGLELQSLALYVIVGFRRDSSTSSEAALKYFVLGALATGFFLYGVSLIYGATASTQYKDVAILLSSKPSLMAMVGIVMVLSAMAFKLSMAPFHMWTPDVYEGAPLPTTAFLAMVPKIGGLGVLIILVLTVFDAKIWQPILWTMSGLSLIVGSFGALRQENLKRLFAYSTIGHMGFMMMGVSCGTESGLQGALIYLFLYAFMTVGLFALLLVLRWVHHPGVKEIDHLKGLSVRHPSLAFVFAVLMFSMAGIPPLAGFFGKFYVLVAVVKEDLYALALLGVLSSVVSAFYYLRIVKIMYFDSADYNVPLGHVSMALPRGITLLLGLSSSVILGYVFVPWTLTSLATFMGKSFSF